ncbi:MAG: helix-turn-helix transcriptional regulator [Pseudomonadota bacterium]
MTDLRRLSSCNRDISKAIHSQGGDAFFPSLIRAILGQIKAHYPQVWLYHRGLPPRVLYHEIPKHAIDRQIVRYLDGPYTEDPFYRLSMNRPRSKIYRLSRITTGRLQESDYYRNYYADSGAIDEIAFLTKLKDGSVINLDIMRLPGEGEFSDAEFKDLSLLAEPVSALMKSHSEHEKFAASHLIQPGIDYQIDLAFRTFGASRLTPREKAVLELMLRGYSPEVSGEKLGIALETVRRHRKNIYHKLDVSSQTDIFSLFINAMSCLAEAAGEDPLSVYMSPR